MSWRHKSTGKVKWAQVISHAAVAVVLLVDLVLLILLVMR